jgi:signal transduction histidine kinase
MTPATPLRVLDRPCVADEATPLLIERVRAALWVILAGGVLFALAHLDAAPTAFLPLYVFKLFHVVLILGLLAALRRVTSRRGAIAVALLGVSGTYAFMAVGDAIADHLETTPLLAVVCGMTTAALLPWGVWPQLLTATLMGIANLWMLGLSGRPLGALVDPAASVTAALGVSVYIAYEFQRYRLARAQAEAALGERARLEALRADLLVDLSEKANPRAIMQAFAETLVRHLDAAFARIWTLNEDESVLDLQASAGIYTHLDGGHARVPAGAFEIGRIAAERRPHLTNAVPEDPHVSDRAWARREGMVAFAGYPLLVEDRLLGVVAVFARHQLSETTLEALASVAQTIAFGIDRARAEEARAHLLEELERANRLKSEFVSTMSHELRTPLNVILGFSQMARDANLSGEEREDCLARIEVAGAELLGLIESTLEIGKIEAGRDEVRLEAVPLLPWWADLGQACARLPRSAAVSLQWKADVAPVSLVTDSRKLTVVIRNLVGNALKFTERGWVRAELRLDSRTLILSVSDTGIGIRPEDHRAIFEMFRQADQSDTRRFGGTGLGLYIVRRFIQQLGGTIELESAPGSGSTFTVRLPGPEGSRVAA